MTAALSAEPAGALSQDAKEQIAGKIDSLREGAADTLTTRSPRSRLSRIRRPVALALAASLVLALIGFAVLPKGSHQVARLHGIFEPSARQDDSEVSSLNQSKESFLAARDTEQTSSAKSPTAPPMKSPAPGNLEELDVVRGSTSKTSEMQALDDYNLLLPTGDAKFGTRDQAIDSKSMYEIVTKLEKFNTEAYDRIDDNPFLDVRQNPLSTFSIDVDTASYAQRAAVPEPRASCRRRMRCGSRRWSTISTTTTPRRRTTTPFAVHVEVAGCPWNAEHRLVRIGLKGREIDARQRPASNLVFLLDVSGSMRRAQQAAAGQGRRCSCWSSSSARTTAWRSSSTPARRGWCCRRRRRTRRQAILDALDRLQAGGSTNGGAGIELAYEIGRAATSSRAGSTA